MKYRHTYLLFLSVLILFSCSITSKLEKRTAKVGLSQPGSTRVKDTTIVNAPKQITYTDSDGNEHIITRAEKDHTTGEEMTVVDLQSITVTARSKNVPERFGKVNLDFIVTVPDILISSKWQLRLTPVLYKAGERIELDKIFLSGADFIKTQQKGYAMYQAFINSIVPDSAYLQQMFNDKGYKKAMSGLEEEFYQSWKRDLLSEKEYIDWNNKVNRRYLLFNGVVEKNKRSLNNSTSLISKLPSYWLMREVDQTAAPRKYRSYIDGNYNIVKKEITAEDSIRISQRFFNYKKMAENERKKELIDRKYQEYVKFPHEQARLDTIIKAGENFQYYYVQEIQTNDDQRKLDLTLEGLVLAKDESTYLLPESDTITYYISSMIQFIDPTPRYKLKIIERKAEVNLTSYIQYPVGRSNIDENYGNNRYELNKVMETINKLTFSGELIMDSINMVASASPEGFAMVNHQLSRQRAQELKKYIAFKTDDKEGIDTLLNARWIGEDWRTLEKLILNSDLPHKDGILNIIRNTTDPDLRESRIRSNYKADYKYVRDHFYPELRAVNFQFNLHRRGMLKDTIHTTVIDSLYLEGVELLRNRKYSQALAILSDYEDYNTGICLMSLGYDHRAYEVLSRQADGSNRNYLMSILAVRLGKEQEAVNLFLRACELDETKIWRGRLDPEISTLMSTYNLFENDEF